MTKKQRKLLLIADGGEVLFRSELLFKYEISPSVADKLVSQGLLSKKKYGVIMYQITPQGKSALGL